MDLKERYLVLLKSIREILKNEDQMHMSFIRKRMNVLLDECIQLEKDIAKEKEWEVGGSGLTEEDKQEINNSLLELKSKIDNQDKKIDENSSQIDEKANKNEVGSPLIANTVAEMIDKTKVYVYLGNEEGYIKGNWYVWNGTIWESGGTYNSQGIGDKSITAEKLNIPFITTHKNIIYQYAILEELNRSDTTSIVFNFSNVLPASDVLVDGQYYIYCKFTIKHTSTIFNANLYLYENATNNRHFIGSTKIDNAGEYVIEGLLDFSAITTGRIKVVIVGSNAVSTENLNITVKCDKIFIIKSNSILSLKNANMSEYISELSIENEAIMEIINEEKIQNSMLDEKIISETNLDDKLVNKLNTSKNSAITIQPVFNLFKDYSNRNIKICIVGDSTSDKNAPSGNLYNILEKYTKSGELLYGATIIARGYSGITASGFISTHLEDIKNDNADLYVVSLGINDVRLGLTTKEQLKSYLTTIVDGILVNEKAHVILRTPNSLGNDDMEEKYIHPYTSAQDYTNILWEAYEELRGNWSVDKVTVLDMQTLIFGRTCVSSADNELMGDVLHPSYAVGQVYLADIIAESIGKKEAPSPFKCNLIKNYERPYMEYPLYLDYAKNEYECLYENIELMGISTAYMTLKGIPSVFSELKTGDIIRFGNLGCYIYEGTKLQIVNGTNTYIPITLTDTEVINYSIDKVWHVSIFRKKI